MTPDLLFLMTSGGRGGSGGMSIFFIQMLAIVAIFYFLIIRPKIRQEKRQRERLADVKKGDRIVTVGGILGDVVHVKDDEITVKSGESRLVVQRGRIADILSGRTEGGATR